MMESKPMRPDEMKSGRYVCVAHGGCLHSPRITIYSDGVWVRVPDSLHPGAYVYTSAHRDCFNKWERTEESLHWQQHIAVHGNEPSLDEFQKERTRQVRELTYKDRAKFTSDQVTARMKELMIPTDYPTEDMFSESEILAEVANLADYYLYEDVATLKQGDYDPAVIVAFGQLAKTLHRTICNQGGELKIRRETTHVQRRAAAVSNLAQRLSQERKDTAIRILLDEE